MLKKSNVDVISPVDYVANRYLATFIKAGIIVLLTIWLAFQASDMLSLILLSVPVPLCILALVLSSKIQPLPKLADRLVWVSAGYWVVSLIVFISMTR